MWACTYISHMYILYYAECFETVLNCIETYEDEISIMHFQRSARCVSSNFMARSGCKPSLFGEQFVKFFSATSSARSNWRAYTWTRKGTIDAMRSLCLQYFFQSLSRALAKFS